MSDFPIAVKTTHSKRHSFSPGPRPLRLALASTATLGSTGPIISPFTPYSTPSPRSESPGSAGAPPNATRFVRNPGALRRQSSISYFTPDSETTTTRTPTRHGLARSVSVVAKPSLSPGVGGGRSGDRRSTVSMESTQSEKVSTPHTLAEKHADLLQFIAQKESKCLELRSQLAVHEAELLQLKRKWERIVDRGFGRSNGISDYTPSNPTSVSSTATQLQSGAMLEGIREGVQGVSRLIAAGLGELSAAPAPSSPTPISTSRQTPARRRHLARPSSSSISTYATNTSNSTRLSQSSASSLGDEPGEAERDDEDEREEALMLKYSDAKPIVNASPERKLNSGPSESSFGISSKDSDRPSISFSPERTAKIHRRKSRDCSSPPSSKSFDLSTTTSPSVVAPSAKQTLKAKRASVNMLPPVASIPGLGSLTTVGGSGGQPVASWVGKKWEEIQSGSAFTKHHKRASVLLSDVSQTIASALSSPPLASTSYNQTLTPYMPTSSSSTGSITPLQSSSSVSLLDEDDTEAALHGGLGGTGLGDVMMPVQVNVQPSAQMGASADIKEGDAGAAQTLDEEDWGW